MNTLPHNMRSPSGPMAEYVSDRYRLKMRQLERRARHPNRNHTFWRNLKEFMTQPAGV